MAGRPSLPNSKGCCVDIGSRTWLVACLRAHEGIRYMAGQGVTAACATLGLGRQR